MRRESATVTELSRVELLAGLPGEALARLGERMEREEVAPGARVDAERDEGERFYVVLSGLLSAPGAVLRPGAFFGDLARGAGAPPAASVQAVTPATVASCDRVTYDDLVRPLFAAG